MHASYHIHFRLARATSGAAPVFTASLGFLGDKFAVDYDTSFIPVAFVPDKFHVIHASTLDNAVDNAVIKRRLACT